MDRAARRERFQRVFGPTELALASVAVVAALLFQRTLSFRVLILAGAVAFAWASGRRVPLLGTCLVMAGIVAANLLVPVGRVLAVWGPFRITQVALREGIEKAVTFEALIYISKAGIRSDLRMPGRFGSLLSAAFRCYERILEIRVKLKPATFFEDLDEVLLSVYDDGALLADGDRGEAPRRGRAGTVILVLIAAAAWTPLLATGVR